MPLSPGARPRIRADALCRLQAARLAEPQAQSRVAHRNRIGYGFAFNAPIAQLDRALPSEGRGQRFESSWVRHFLDLTATRFARASDGAAWPAGAQSRLRTRWVRNGASKVRRFSLVPVPLDPSRIPSSVPGSMLTWNALRAAGCGSDPARCAIFPLFPFRSTRAGCRLRCRGRCSHGTRSGLRGVKSRLQVARFSLFHGSPGGGRLHPGGLTARRAAVLANPAGSNWHRCRTSALDCPETCYSIPLAWRACQVSAYCWKAMAWPPWTVQMWTNWASMGSPVARKVPV